MGLSRNGQALGMAVAPLTCCETVTRGTRVSIDVDSGMATVRESLHPLSDRMKVVRTTCDNLMGL